MGYKRVEFNEKGFDEIRYKKYFSQNQAEYIRRKLRSKLAMLKNKYFIINDFFKCKN